MSVPTGTYKTKPQILFNNSSDWLSSNEGSKRGAYAWVACELL